VIGSAPLTFQWLRNGAPVPGGTNLTLTVPQASAAQAGDYSMLVSNAAGSAVSLPAMLVVLSLPEISIAATSESITLSCVVPTGRACAILVSTNLVTWSVLTNPVVRFPRIDFSDPILGGASQRFYRILIGE
jgi:hypothetical protein